MLSPWSRKPAVFFHMRMHTRKNTETTPPCFLFLAQTLSRIREEILAGVKPPSSVSVHEADEVFRTVMACNGKRWIKGLRETAIGSITIGQIDVSVAYSSLQLIHRGTLFRDERSTYSYFHLFYLGKSIAGQA